MDAGSHLRGGLSSACPLPVGKEPTKGHAARVPEGLAPLTATSMSPLRTGTWGEAWKEDEAVCFWELSG